MSKRLHLMIDIDDVIFPWFDGILTALTNEWGLPDGPVSWNMWDGWWGKTRDDWGDIVAKEVRNGFYLNTKPVLGSTLALQEFIDDGHWVHLVTARGFMERGYQIRCDTLDWLHDFEIPYHTLTFAKDKVKAQETLGFRFDAAVDDGTHNFHALTEAGIPTFLQDAPHNQDVVTDKRIAGLYEFGWAVDDLAQDNHHEGALSAQ